MDDHQKTIRQPIRLEGKGIHSGRAAVVILKPLPAGSGVCFRRSDLPASQPVRATIEHVYNDHGRQTGIGTRDWKIYTIEHLMATFHGLGVDNVLVEVSGEELPALDGSAKTYADEITRIGLEEQDAPREYIQLTSPIYFRDKDASIAVFPAPELSVSYTLSYGHPDLSDQFFTCAVTPELFASEIAPARTFCLKEEAEALRRQGFGKGADFDNTLVFDKDEPMQNALRFPNEACRHKVMDLLGDLYLVGQRFQAHIVACRTGHQQNHELAKRLSDFRTNAHQLRQDFKLSSVKGELNADVIKQVLPHRYPFLFVDRVLEMEVGKRIVGIKKVLPDEYFFQGHFPGHPVMPGVLIIEALAQCGGFLMLSKPENQGKIAYFMTIEKAKFRQPVLPGEELRLEAEVIRDRSRTGECAGRAYVGDKLVCEAEVRFAVVEASA